MRKNCKVGQATNDNIYFFSKLLDNVEKYCRAREATDDNMAHAHYMLDT